LLDQRQFHLLSNVSLAADRAEFAAYFSNYPRRPHCNVDSRFVQTHTSLW
jgi:hypothetical protein